MKIDKAIELLREVDEGCDPDACIGEKEAVKLGIEGLKRIQRQRKNLQPHEIKLLPGETE